MQCKEPEKYPVEPQIKFEYFTRFDTITKSVNGQIYLYYNRGALCFSYTDGDGDLGVKIDSTLPADFANMFITYYEIQNNDTVRVALVAPDTGDTMTYNTIIPNLTPEYFSGNGIKGEISDTLFIFPTSPYDTILFQIYIQDRAGHKSNTITTPFIVRKLKI
jgi:hypothetical protein